ETHISYPVLAYYRSQHDDQSWVAALLMILDTSTLVLVSENHLLHNLAKSTFAIARHAAVDLTEVFWLTPHSPLRDRMPKQDLVNLMKLLKDSDFSLKEGVKAEEKLIYLRTLYEPYIQSLSSFFLMPITPFVSDGKVQEAWRKNI
ncbi:MAG TPA: two pore domain potassium channel family protein, partial [Patescibacteria group bacterium]|nr:two pore domain potassium channel family protein [Patescibacteria group bacterium]